MDDKEDTMTHDAWNGMKTAATSTGTLGNNGTGSATGLEERLYLPYDAKHKVTSLADTSGTIVRKRNGDVASIIVKCDAGKHSR